MASKMAKIAFYIATMMTATATAAEVGCYWYPRQCVLPGMALTDRNISSLPLRSCTYLDIGNLCLFNVTAEGTLHHGEQGCARAAEEVVEDVLLAKKKLPHLKAYYEIWDVTPAYGDSPGGHMFVKIFSNSSLLERWVMDLAAWTKAHPGAVDGFNVDWELTLDLTDPIQASARRGLTTFLRRLKEETGLGVTFDIGSLSGFENIADVHAIQPYIDHLELMSYFTNLSAPLQNIGAPTQRGLQDDIRDLLSPRKYNYSASQITIGVGLSSDSVMNVSVADLPWCAYWGWGCVRPADGQPGPPTTSGPHDTVGLHTPTWDMIEADVAAGKGRRGVSGAKQGHAWWYFFPNPDNMSEGEVTWWNDEQDLDRFTGFVRRWGLGGVFTWIATSDATDWRVHKRLHAALNVD